jgi:hypothetical protein
MRRLVVNVAVDYRNENEAFHQALNQRALIESGIHLRATKPSVTSAVPVPRSRRRSLTLGAGRLPKSGHHHSASRRKQKAGAHGPAGNATIHGRRNGPSPVRSCEGARWHGESSP